MDDQDDSTGSVGYKKPPRHGQFKPGESGNPKGRPKGSKNLNTIMQKELNTRVPITENGKRKLISKQEAIVKQTVHKAINGDHKAAQLVLHEARQSEEQICGGSVGALHVPVSPEDQLVIDSIVRRIRLGNLDPELSAGAAEAKAPEPKGEPE